jgi:hypothetical protein
MNTEVLEFCQHMQNILGKFSDREFAVAFVEARMAFARTYTRDYLFSTSHGLEFFQNVLDCASDKLVWKEEGEYGNNFRKFIKSIKTYEEKPATPKTV